MTSPIKPPGGPRTPDADATDVQGTRSEGASFDEVLAAQSSPPSAPSSTVAAHKSDELRAITEQVRSGQLGLEGALDRLVERALSTATAQGLTPTGRRELEQHLRDMLAHDPSLQTLLRDAERNA